MDYGPGVSTDAVEYLSAAESFSTGQGFINYKGEPYHLWSPLYPFVLAVPKALFGIDPLQTGWVLNVIASGLIIWLSWVVINKCVPERKVWAYLGALTVLFSVSLLGVAANIASDPIFIVMVLVFFLLFDRFIQKGERWVLVLLTAVAGLAAIQRYLGVTLILSGFFGILYFCRQNHRQGILDSLSFLILASLPVVGWVSRNWFLTGTFFGVRNPSKWLLGENLNDAFVKIMHWFFPYNLVSEPIFSVAVLAVLILGVTRLNRDSLVSIQQKLNRPINFILVVF
jgi:hypothetical protein